MGFVGTAPAASYICSGNDAPGHARRVCSPRAQALSQLLERVIQDAPSPTRSALQRRGLRYYPSATTSQNIRCIPYISVGTTDTPWIWGFSYTLDGSSFSERLITVGSLEITIGHYLCLRPLHASRRPPRSRDAPVLGLDVHNARDGVVSETCTVGSVNEVERLAGPPRGCSPQPRPLDQLKYRAI